MRGSDAYMQGLKREIDALINHEIHTHRRLPSFFLTFSCAEFYWKVLLDLLAEFMVNVEPRLNGVKPDLHTNASLRFQKLQEYAHVVTLFFEQRAMSFHSTGAQPAADPSRECPGRGPGHGRLVCPRLQHAQLCQGASLLRLLLALPAAPACRHVAHSAALQQGWVWTGGTLGRPPSAD